MKVLGYEVQYCTSSKSDATNEFTSVEENSKLHLREGKMFRLSNNVIREVTFNFSEYYVLPLELHKLILTDIGKRKEISELIGVKGVVTYSVSVEEFQNAWGELKDNPVIPKFNSFL
jgi:hypothetical protein